MSPLRVIVTASQHVRSQYEVYVGGFESGLTADGIAALHDVPNNILGVNVIVQSSFAAFLCIVRLIHYNI